MGRAYQQNWDYYPKENPNNNDLKVESVCLKRINIKLIILRSWHKYRMGNQRPIESEIFDPVSKVRYKRFKCSGKILGIDWG